MPSSLRHTVWRWSLAGLLSMAAMPVCVASARLLVVVESVAASPWHAQFIETLRTSLRVRHRDLEFDVETFAKDAGAPLRDGDVPDWVLRKYAGQRYDIVLAGSAEYVQSVVALRDRLWPGASVVVQGANMAQQAALRGVPRLVGVDAGDASVETLSLVFKLLPKTRHVAVIANTLDQDPFRPNWPRTVAELQGRAQLIDLSGLSSDGLRERVRTLPPDTAIYFAAPGTAVRRVATPRDLLTELAGLANAPVFVDGATMLGTGAVGGALLSPNDLARDVAQQIEALLAGEASTVIGFKPRSAPALQFDWHALRRWGIPLDRLPPGSEVIHRPPDLWPTYRNQVIVGGGVVVVQSGLIAALLLERRRRRRAELQARQHLSDLARLNRGAALGALSAALAHEINQPLGAILSNAETAELLLDRPGDTQRDSVRELLGEIREDSHRAAAVLERLKAWIANAPNALGLTALNPLLIEVSRLLATELRLRNTELQLVLAPDLPEVMADAVQLQQVVLNLLMNALDALDAAPARQRRIVLATAARGPSEVEVSVQDNGPGLAGLSSEQLFEPFFTTKPEGLGIGLAISRAIIERHHGRICAEEKDGGARFCFTLPLGRKMTMATPAL